MHRGWWQSAPFVSLRVSTITVWKAKLHHTSSGELLKSCNYVAQYRQGYVEWKRRR
jgi:hypothetical protein